MNRGIQAAGLLFLASIFCCTLAAIAADNPSATTSHGEIELQGGFREIM